jgi:hypothetical protein
MSKVQKDSTVIQDKPFSSYPAISTPLDTKKKIEKLSLCNLTFP